MRDKENPQRRFLMAFGIAAICAAAGSAGVGAALAQSTPSENDYNIAALTRPASANDLLPSNVLNSSQPVKHDSSRLLAEKDGVQYWTGLDENGNVCLIAYFGTDQWVSGQSCTSQEIFLKSGSGLRLYGPEGLIEAYLVPDGVRVDGPTTQITDNVYIVDPHLEASMRAINLKSDGTSDEFQLALFGEPFSSTAKQ